MAGRGVGERRTFVRLHDHGRHDPQCAPLARILFALQIDRHPQFSIERISKHRSIMTDGKLAFLNKQHLSILFDAPQTRKNVLQRTVNLLKPAFPASTILSDEAAMARFLNVMKVALSFPPLMLLTSITK